MNKMSSLVLFFHSIRFRLVMWFSFILTIVMITFSVFIYYNQARDIRGDTLNRLESKMNDIDAALTGNLIDPRILQSNDVFILFDSNGKVLVNQGISSGQDVLTLINHAQTSRQSVDNHAPVAPIFWMQDWKGSSSQYFFIVNQITLDGQSGFAILGSPFDPYGLNNRLIFSLILGSILTILIALGGGLWLADRAMRPVKAITQAARTISETDLNRRLNIAGKDELAELAATFDGMLARLQMAFERQRQFVADASHELRTPLTIVNLEANRALAAKRTQQEYHRALEVIRSENEFMTHLVNQLLTMARMDAGQLVLTKEPIDLSDVTLDAVERLASLAEKNKVILETGELPEVKISGDRPYLMQMISNLVGNSIKYTAGDDRHISVETGIDLDIAWVRVSDNGVGIAPEHLPHLFDRFYRVDKARSREDDDQQGGTGLGLSIVDWIVKAHGGEVYVESSLGIGTTFEIRFRWLENPDELLEK